MTPVPEGYFTHLERIRGESKKMKVIENAREAVSKGTATGEEVAVAMRGAQVRENGDVVAADGEEGTAMVNGYGRNGDQEEGEESSGVNGEDGGRPKRRRTGEMMEYEQRRNEQMSVQDISIHNQTDYYMDD